MIFVFIFNKKNLRYGGFFYGADRETRTPDPLITNHLGCLDFIVYNQFVMLILKAVFQSSYHRATTIKQAIYNLLQKKITGLHAILLILTLHYNHMFHP